MFGGTYIDCLVDGLMDVALRLEIQNRVTSRSLSFEVSAETGS